MTKICFRSALNTFFVGVAYAASTYYVARYRHEDDEFNHIIGGLGASIATGIVCKSGQAGVTAAVIFPALGYFHKKKLTTNDQVRIKHYLMSTKNRFNCSFAKNKNLTGNWTNVPTS